MRALRKALTRALKTCVKPLARFVIRQLHVHVIQPAPLPHPLEDFCREARVLIHDLGGRMERLETRFAEGDVVLSSIVRELTRLQLQSEVLHETLGAPRAPDKPLPESSRDYRQAG
jgi:hypothetical protein